MARWARYLLLLTVVGLVSVSQIATTQAGSTVTQVATLNVVYPVFPAPVAIQAIVMCPTDPSVAYIGAAGPDALDDFALFKVTGADTASPKIDHSADVFFGDNDDWGPGPGLNSPSLPGQGSGLPAGMGPRGFPGLALGLECQHAYIPNFFLDSVVKVDLSLGATNTANNASGSVNFNDGTIIWPKGFEVDHLDPGGLSLLSQAVQTIPSPVDAQLNYPEDTRLIVSSAAGFIYVLDGSTGQILAKVATGGLGTGGLVVNGEAWAAAVEASRDLACVDLQTYQLANTIPGLGIKPFMAVLSNDGSTIYVSNQGSNTVSVLTGGGCNKAVTATIPVGNEPQYLALSPDNRFLYVSDSVDNTVDVIDTASLSVVDTIQVAKKGEPAPVRVVAVSGNNRYLYAYWEGGVKGTPGKPQLKVFDVCALYVSCGN